MRAGSDSRALGNRGAALFFVAFGVSLSLGLAGCGPKVVASVNGDRLTEAEFAKLCENFTQFEPRRGGTVGRQVLAIWINDQILAQEARRLKVYPSEKELDQRVDAFRRQMAYAGEDLQASLARQGITEAGFRGLRLRDLLQENIFCNGITVSDEEVKKVFDQQKSGLTQPERVQISQITLDSPEQVKKAKDDLATGDFANVAQTRSKDVFAAQGGRVPQDLTRQIQPGAPVNQKAVTAAFSLKPGQVSEPIQIDGGNWVIVRLEKKIEKKEPVLDDFKDMIRAALRQQKAAAGKGQQTAQRIVELSRTADVRIERAEYKALADELKSLPGAMPAAEPGHEGHNHGPGVSHGPEGGPPPAPGG
jgi:parvulin-like peptidyl-prolyl isomerase